MPEDIEEDIDILIAMYQDLLRRYNEANYPADYLQSTAGVELFNTDHNTDHSFPPLQPDVSYVLSSLGKAEENLNKYLSKREHSGESK